MVPSSPVPWYDRPARPFPALIWMEQRYAFRIPPLRFARHPGYAGEPSALVRRPFPAKVWLAERQNALGL